MSQNPSNSSCVAIFKSLKLPSPSKLRNVWRITWQKFIYLSSLEILSECQWVLERIAKPPFERKLLLVNDRFASSTELIFTLDGWYAIKSKFKKQITPFQASFISSNTDVEQVPLDIQTRIYDISWSIMHIYYRYNNKVSCWNILPFIFTLWSFTRDFNLFSWSIYRNLRKFSYTTFSSSVSLIRYGMLILWQTWRSFVNIRWEARLNLFESLSLSFIPCLSKQICDIKNEVKTHLRS